jgi:NitT/TauT family transport system ATP-binding protein/sulfonate transport system ATP-binding protein
MDVLRQLVADHEPTVLLVTHLPEDAAMLADRAVVLGGRPVRVVADIVFEVPRQDRNRADIERIADQIEALRLEEVT